MMACNKTRKSNRHTPAYPYANGFVNAQYPPQPVPPNQAPPRGACNGHAWAQGSYNCAATAPSVPPPQHANCKPHSLFHSLHQGRDCGMHIFRVGAQAPSRCLKRSALRLTSLLCRHAPGCAPPVPPQASRSPAFYPPHHSAHRGPQFHQGPKTSGRVVSPPSGLGVVNGYDSSSSSGSAHSHNRGKPDAHSRSDQGSPAPLRNHRSIPCVHIVCLAPTRQLTCADVLS